MSPTRYAVPARTVAFAHVMVIALLPMLLFGDYACFLHEKLSPFFPSMEMPYAATLCH